MHLQVNIVRKRTIGRQRVNSHSHFFFTNLSTATLTSTSSTDTFVPCGATNVSSISIRIRRFNAKPIGTFSGVTKRKASKNKILCSQKVRSAPKYNSTYAVQFAVVHDNQWRSAPWCLYRRAAIRHLVRILHDFIISAIYVKLLPDEVAWQTTENATTFRNAQKHVKLGSGQGW